MSIYATIKNVFVTGADGMLGSNVVRELIRQGYQPHCLVFPGRHTGTLDGLPVRIVSGDLMHTDSLEKAVEGCDAIIHVAASTAIWPGRNPQVMKVNLEGTRSMIEVAKKTGIRRFVHIGSANSFAAGTVIRPGDEEGGYENRKFQNNYIDSKYLSQQLLLDEYQRNKFPVIILNPTFMIGPYDSGPSSGRMVLSVVQGKVPGFSRGVKNFVHAADVAVAAVNALQMGRLGHCYIAGHENMDYERFFRLVCSVAGIPFRLRYIPYPLVLTAGLFGSVWGRISATPPKLSFGMARMSAIQQYYTPAKAVKELQMPQTPVAEAVRDCLDWFQKHHHWTPEK
jgi:dihydroflavonol-4-reductase